MHPGQFVSADHAFALVGEGGGLLIQSADVRDLGVELGVIRGRQPVAPAARLQAPPFEQPCRVAGRDLVDDAAGHDRIREFAAGPVADRAAGVVTVPRTFVDYVVTEYGIATLRGQSLKQRANDLIAIAHPDYRAGLAKQARELYGA